MDDPRTIPVLNIGNFIEDAPLEGFYSNELGRHLIANEEIVSKSHKHDFYLCVVFTQGKGIHEIDFNSYPVSAGSVFFLRPGQTHRWAFEERPEGYIFFHDPDILESNFWNMRLSHFPFYSYKNPQYLMLDDQRIKDIIPFFKALVSEYRGKGAYRNLRSVNLVGIIYVDLARLYVDENISGRDRKLPPRYLQLLDAFEEMVERNFKNEKLPRFYADALNLTTKHLNRVVKTTLGKTSTELITERTMLEAKRLMVHSDKSLTDISEILGYMDYTYFSKIFKRNTGQTPMGFRAKYTH